VIAGARYYDNGQTDEGRAYVYARRGRGPGGDGRLDGRRATKHTPTLHIGRHGRGRQRGRVRGPDVVARCPYDNGQTDEGRAFVYLGSAAGLAADGRVDGGERPSIRLLWHIGRHGRDVNGDGYGGRDRRRELLRQRPDR